MAVSEKTVQASIADWLGDLVALESHVEEAMDKQLKLKSGSPKVSEAFQHFHDTVKASKDRAVAYQKSYGSTAGNPIIKAGANLLGKAAGVIDKMRDDSASKALRDDYTAYNHLAIAYTMLNTTGLALKDQATADFAKEGLTTYAGLVQEINHLMPDAVVWDLATNENEPSVDSSVPDQARRIIDQVWKQTS